MATIGRAKIISGSVLRLGVVAVVSMGSALNLVASRQSVRERFTFTQYHMGIDARIVVYVSSQTQAEDACRAAFARIAELDSVMSDYRKDSELNRLCDKAGSGPVKVSQELFAVLERAVEVSARTNGAFDVTAAPVIQLWRQARKSGKLPDRPAIKSALKLVGWRKIKLDRRARTVALASPGMRLDLGGIAKGYAGDEAVRVLKSNGVTSSLVEMGGDLVMGGPPDGLKGWTIAVPNAGDDRGPKNLVFSNQGVSTSGDTEQFTVINGVQYSHVVDPRTGMALTNRIQATVVGKAGLLTDPLSTACTVLGAAERTRFLRMYPGVKVYIRSLAGR